MASLRSSIHIRSRARKSLGFLAKHTSQRLSSTSLSTSPPFPVIKHCPPATCSCMPTPSDLQIDKTSPLKNTAPKYTEHVVICTGKDDWVPRIEDEVPDRGQVNLAAGLKSAFGRPRLLKGGGKFYNPDRVVLVTNSSFPPTPAAESSTAASSQGSHSSQKASSAYLFPSFQYVPKIDQGPKGLDTFIETHIESPSSPSHAIPITTPTILICGHGGRDQRCGIMGPLLQSEFETQLKRVGIKTTISPPTLDEGPNLEPTARVALISHIGGHKWAGNVIVCLPKGTTTRGVNQTASKSIWYGRVEPRHVEGIVKETVLVGTVIDELCRGVI